MDDTFDVVKCSTRKVLSEATCNVVAVVARYGGDGETRSGRPFVVPRRHSAGRLNGLRIIEPNDRLRKRYNVAFTAYIMRMTDQSGAVRSAYTNLISWI